MYPVTAPLDPSQMESDIGSPYSNLTITGLDVHAFLTDCIFSLNDQLIHAFWAVAGSSTSITALALTLRSGKGANANLVQMIQQPGRWDSYEGRYVAPPARLGYRQHWMKLAGDYNDYALDKVSCGQRTWEVAMYPLHAKASSDAHNFTLIFPYAWDEDRRLHHIYTTFNHRLSLPLAPDWVGPLWDYLIDVRSITQLDSFGRFVGFRVSLDELSIRRFISRELRGERIFFPGARQRITIAA